MIIVECATICCSHMHSPLFAVTYYPLPIGRHKLNSLSCRSFIYFDFRLSSNSVNLNVKTTVTTPINLWATRNNSILLIYSTTAKLYQTNRIEVYLI